MTSPSEVSDHRDVPIIAETSRTTVIMRIEDCDDRNRTCGFHLSRSKWDPYPWVGCVEAGSVADVAGLRAGDCLLEIDGTDLVGLRVKDIAALVRRDDAGSVRLEVWRSPRQTEADEGAALSGPLPEVAKKLARAISGTVRALECPVCLESATSPVAQCVHGHILCVGCRAKTPRCPVCRVRLGQGRCLLADEVQRNIREAFEETRDDGSPSGATLSLREKLFGRANGKVEDRPVDFRCNNRVSHARLKSSLARLLLGGFDKAASAENLSVATLVDESATMIDGRPAAYRRLGELSQTDRTKSASTGELSKGTEPPADSRLGSKRPRANVTPGFLSVPQTPTWGGSAESVNGAPHFLCPLARSTSCREIVTASFVLEHLARSHDDPQVHFHGRTAVIPLPLPFGRDASYVMHHRGELFFFQYDDEAAWIAGSGTDNIGEWTMLGQNGDGTEVKFRRQLARLDDTSAPLPRHLAPLPRALGLNTLVVELIDSQLAERLEV